MDSIIRQSRHQFGEDKDVFGPRFLKNISGTFQSLYECPPDDKVLNCVLKTSAGFKHVLMMMMMVFCLNKGQDPACVESVAEELGVQYGHHSEAGGHGVGSGGVCCGEW